jgi:ubiquinone/menaquinone biosynthesis C-methylase UbiE
MTNQDKLTKEDAIKANIYVHSFLANAGEYNKSPHFRPENQEKVRNILIRLTARLAGNPATKVVDFGCGTGFMIHLMSDLFQEVHGVDVTQDMMRQVDLSTGNVYLHESLAESTPFEGDSFDFATAYSFMDHLYNYKDFLKEAYRVLKPGGVFYSDLNPNRGFILAIADAEQDAGGMLQITPIVEREVLGALHNGQYYQQNYGMDGSLLEKAEPIKSLEKGFDALEVLNCAHDIGFAECHVEYEWFLGQAKVMHEQSKADSDTVETYLNSVLPVSSHLFKYLRFVLVK